MIVYWPRSLFYVVTVIVLGLDQLTKAWATMSLEPLGTAELIPGFFSLTYVRNTGVAFGMFAGQGLLVGVFMIILIITAFYFMKGLNWAAWEPNIVGGCLCGGAVGNLIDRWHHGFVVDFFDVYVGPHHWPVFNMADSFICIAVGWIVLRQLIGEKKSTKMTL